MFDGIVCDDHSPSIKTVSPPHLKREEISLCIGWSRSGPCGWSRANPRSCSYMTGLIGSIRCILNPTTLPERFLWTSPPHAGVWLSGHSSVINLTWWFSMPDTSFWEVPWNDPSSWVAIWCTLLHCFTLYHDAWVCSSDSPFLQGSKPFSCPSRDGIFENNVYKTMIWHVQELAKSNRDVVRPFSSLRVWCLCLLFGWELLEDINVGCSSVLHSTPLNSLISRFFYLSFYFCKGRLSCIKKFSKFLILNKQSHELINAEGEKAHPHHNGPFKYWDIRWCK